MSNFVSMRYTFDDVFLWRDGHISRGSPHRPLDPDPMRIEVPDPTTTLLPRGLNADPSCVREIQSSSAMRVVRVPCAAHAIPQWKRIGNPDPVNSVSVSVWRALLSLGVCTASDITYPIAHKSRPTIKLSDVTLTTSIDQNYFCTFWWITLLPDLLKL